MAARYRQDKVPKLRISFRELERKCSELLLDGFESKPTESDLGDRDGIPSSSCNENDDGTNICNDIKQSGLDSPKKGGNPGLFQIKRTALQASPQKVSGSQLSARRRRGSEQPERHQRLIKEDEGERFSEPTKTRSTRSNRWAYPDDVMMAGRTSEDADQKYAPRQANSKTEREQRARLRRHTDDGRIADQRFYQAPREERGVGGQGRRSQSEGHKLSSSSAAAVSDKDSALLADWQRYTDGRIQKALSRLYDQPSKLTQILHTCSRLQETGKNLLLSSLEVSTRQEVSSKMWKCAHYPVIEVLRRQATETEESAQRDQLESFLKSCTTFYLSLVESIEKKYGFQVASVLAGKANFNSKTHLRTVMMALSVCECFYIYLGDLTRYYQQCIQDKPDWSKPRSYYLKAQSLAPKDGKPYNQLAVVALNAHRRLDACYYYMRSLKAKVPFQSAMDRLVGLFEDASRKAKRVEEEEQKMKKKVERDAARKKKKAERLKNRRLKQQDKSKSPFVQQFSSGRKEVWIMPGTEVQQSDQSGCDQVGVANKEPATTVDDYYTSFTHSEVLKKLVSAFLVTHGKLFTKIGIELFEGSRDRLLELWLIYWTRRSELTTGDTTRLLKMATINIFSIHNAQEMHTDEGSSRYYVGLAFSLALQLNTTLLSACTQITELVPASAPETAMQPQCKDTLQEHSPGSMAKLSMEETAASNDDGVQPQEQDDDKKEDSELELSPLPQGQPSPVIPGERPGSPHTCWSPHEWGSSILADASVELLCALDLLAIILPSVRVWLQWMRTQKNLWMSFSFKNIETSLMHKFLTSSFAFINKAMDLFPTAASHQAHWIDGVGVGLWEDRVMAGFMPLKAELSLKDTFSIPDLSKLSTQQLREQCVLRILEMARLYKDLCDIIYAIPNVNFTTKCDPATMRFSLAEKDTPPDMNTTASPSTKVATSRDDEMTEDSNGRHSDGNTVANLNNSKDHKEDAGDLDGVSSGGEDMEGGYESDTSGSSSSSSSGGEDVVVEGYGASGEEEEEGERLTEEGEEEALVTASIQQLKEQREALARQVEAHKKAAETAESVLSEAASRERYEVHIAPKYLIPDTNCYVDLLPSIKRLVDSTHFTIAVPLTVLAELEGLSKGSLEPSLKKNASRTTSGAKAAVEYIKGEFSGKSSHVKALTTQGSLMSSISFRAEVTGKASNDDHILQSCLNLHSKVDKQKANQTDAVDYYSVVLLTDDRNLRVKALANSLPVRDLPDFMKLLTPTTT